MPKPNILIITPHDLGDYLGCYGTPVSTPNIDSIAEAGVLFENHFSTGTVCSPSRGSIITGCYPHTHGLMGLVHRGWELDVEKYPPLPVMLRAAGYETHLFGFQHEHWDPRRLGYEHIHARKSHHVEDAVLLFIEWLHTRHEDAPPFLAGMGFTEVHRLGLNPSHFKRDVYEPADPAAVEVRPYLPDIPQIREDLADFYGAIQFMDKTIGELLRALAEAGIADDTLLIFTSDHGASFMHSKATLYDGGTKVPWIMRWPKGLPAGNRVRALSSHVDIVPTILSLTGLPIPAHIEGQNLAHLARQEGGPERAYVFAEKNITNYYDPARMVRSHRYKYIRKGLQTCIFDFIIPEIELCSSDFRRTREVFQHYSARRCREELYDLEKDPGELVNLVSDPAYQAVLDQLRTALDAHLEATHDPFKDLRNDILLHETAYEAVGRLRWGASS